MKEKKEKYFGIEFPKEINLPISEKRKLAKMLFLSPTTSVYEAKSIISNTKLITVASRLINTLNCELESVETKQKKGKIKTLEKFLINKIDKWEKEFELPTVSEFEELIAGNFINKTGVWREIYQKTLLNSLVSPVDYDYYLSDYVIGQESSIKAISVSLFEHKLRFENSYSLPKTPTLLIGPTGSGKSYLIQKSADLLDCPLITINCANLVPSGIVGTTIGNCLTNLYNISGKMINKMSKAIIHFDEFDKLSSIYHQSDNFKANIQMELLRFFDKNEDIFFQSSSSQYSDQISVSVNNFMLVFSGAFTGIDKMIFERLNQDTKGQLGLIDQNNLMQYCSTKDLIQYGIIPELAGRFVQISRLNKLNASDLFDIIQTAKESEYKLHLEKCKVLGLNIVFRKDALKAISEIVYYNNLGVRGISAVLNDVLSEFYYNHVKYRGKDIVIDSRLLNYLLIKRKHSGLLNEFSKGLNFETIASKYNANIDEVIEMYSIWKSNENIIN